MNHRLPKLPKASTKKEKRGAKPGQWGVQPYVADDKTRALVKSLVAFGITQDGIAAYLQISDHTLREHYPHELRIGKVEAIAKMAQGVYKRGIEGSIQDAHFYLKTQGRWSEKYDLDLNPDGKPVTFNFNFDKNNRG